MPDLDAIAGLQIDEEVLDLFVLQPDALSPAERAHVRDCLNEHASLRCYVEDLRAFYEEMEAEPSDPFDGLEADFL